jgi:hypothetical protein
MTPEDAEEFTEALLRRSFFVQDRTEPTHQIGGSGLNSNEVRSLRLHSSSVT